MDEERLKKERLFFFKGVFYGVSSFASVGLLLGLRQSSMGRCASTEMCHSGLSVRCLPGAATLPPPQTESSRSRAPATAARTVEIVYI